MKKYTWLGLATVLFISFQNCAPVKKTDEAESEPIAFDKVTIQDFSTIDLWDADCDESCSGEQIRTSQAKFLHVKLYDRLIESFPIQNGMTREKVCLSEDQVQSLSVILAGAEVCLPVIPDGYYDNRVCTMEMRNPYAILDKNESYEMPLGLKSGGCDIPADLCGDKAHQLQQWTLNIVSEFRAGHLEAASNSGTCE